MKLEKWLMWNQSINLLISQFTPLILSSIINFYDMRFHNDQIVSYISIIFSILVLCLISGSLLAIFIKLRSLFKNQDLEKIKEFNQKYSPLTADLKKNSLTTLIIYWRAIVLVRWLITLIILLILNNYPAIQTLLLLILSISWQLIIIKSQPYDSKLTNTITFFNELAVSAYLYLVLMLSDYLESQHSQSNQLFQNRTKIGWAITILICFVIAVNLLAFIINKVIELSHCLRLRNERLRQNEDRVVSLRPLESQRDKTEGGITHVNESQADQVEIGAEEFKKYFKKN